MIRYVMARVLVDAPTHEKLATLVDEIKNWDNIYWAVRMVKSATNTPSSVNVAIKAESIEQAQPVLDRLQLLEHICSVEASESLAQRDFLYPS